MAITAKQDELCPPCGTCRQVIGGTVGAAYTDYFSKYKKTACNKYRRTDADGIYSKGVFMKYRSGFIAIVGRPNAGKSTLLNAILKEKVAITTPKPQTTRNNISGILTTEDTQYVFVDTPGIHKPKHELGRTLNKNAYTAISEADVNFWVVDATQPYGSGDEFMLEKMKSAHIPVFLILNKIDLLEKEKLLKVLARWQERMEFAEIFPISALTNDNIEHLLEITRSYLSEGPKFFWTI